MTKQVEIRLIGLKEAIEELSKLLRKSAEECSETCHMDCTHEEARFYLHCAENSRLALASERDKLKAELARLQWQPITPENLPKVGDEIFGSRTDGRGIHIRLLPEGYTSPVARVGDFTCAGWTHFRPANLPKEAA